MEKTKPKKKRLVRGKDWHAWAWKDKRSGGLSWAAKYLKTDGAPGGDTDIGPHYKWVRVKFVEVKS